MRVVKTWADCVRESNSAHAAVGVERERANGDVRERESMMRSQKFIEEKRRIMKSGSRIENATNFKR